MIVGVLKEQAPETRVSLVPEVVSVLTKMNVTVWIEAGAGASAFYLTMLTPPQVL
jgi:NAD(P) transhydrogenase subunit alpha